MDLFSHPLEEDILLGLEYLKASLRAGKSLETAAQEISTKQFGPVSSLFGRAVRSGKPVRISLHEIAEQQKTPYLKDLVAAVLADPRTFQRLSYQLTCTLKDQRKTELEDSKQRVELIGGWLVLLPLLPVALLLMDLMNRTLADIPAEAGLSLPKMLFPPAVKIAALALGAAVIVVLLLMMRGEKKMIIEIALAASIALFVTYTGLESRKRRFEEALLQSMENIALRLNKRETLPAALRAVATGKDPASLLIAKMVAKSKTVPLCDAIRCYENAYGSQLLTVFAHLACGHLQTRVAISDQLHDLVENAKSLRRTTQDFLHETALSTRAIQFLGCIGIPILVIFIQEILDVPAFPYSVYFMGFVAVMYGSLDYVIFSKPKKTAVSVPLFFFGFLFAVTKLAGYVSVFFGNFFR